MTYEDILSLQSWWMLRAIALAYGWDFDTHWAKAEASALLTRHFNQAGVLEDFLAGLTDEARLALYALKNAAGSLPRHLFESRFGAIREYRPWREESPLSAAPHRRDLVLDLAL